MVSDDRDILDLLQEELFFVEQGGYGRSVRTPWLPKSTFEDSLTCINYGDPNRSHPCNECHLSGFVSLEHQHDPVPCHAIVINDHKETIDDLETQDNYSKLEHDLKGWLRQKITTIQFHRSKVAEMWL